MPPEQLVLLAPPALRRQLGLLLRLVRLDRLRRVTVRPILELLDRLLVQRALRLLRLVPRVRLGCRRL